MNLITKALSACVFVSFPFGAMADTSAELAQMPKSDFMERYEGVLASLMEVQSELFIRFDAELGAGAVDTGPMTDAEREAMECLWDSANEQGLLDALANQIMTSETIRQMAKDDPEMDIVDLFMNPDTLAQQVAETTEALLPSMQDCGTIQASSHRTSLSPEIWAAFGAAAQERGYSE